MASFPAFIVRDWPRLAAAFCVIAMAPWAAAEDDVIFDPAVQPAGTEFRPVAQLDPSHAAAPNGQRVHFDVKPTQISDRVTQRMGVDLSLQTKIVQSGQVAHEGPLEMRRQQERTIDVLEIVDGRATKARVGFKVSRRQSPDSVKPNELLAQPIEGKSYLAVRKGEQLNVTDMQGAIPPLEEYKLAMESLDSVGKPNPLAALLSGRSIAVGERLLVPREVARSLLGVNEQLGAVQRFEVSLVRVDDKPAGAPRAVFRANIALVPDKTSPMDVKLSGEMAVEPASCRLIALDLAGPVQMASIERAGGAILQYSAAGQLRMAMRAQYGRDGD